jgi:hypothetical protein
MYRVPIKIDGIERRKKSAGLLHVLAGLFLITSTTNYFKLSGYQNFFSVLPLYAIAAASLVYGLLRNKIDPKTTQNHRMRMLQFLSFAVLSILMFKAEMDSHGIMLLIWAGMCLLFLFTEKKVLHTSSLSFEEKAVTVPGYFSNKVLPWEAIENLIVRQDYITIYLAQNKYIQTEVLAELNEKEIRDLNDFCQQHLVEKQKEPV